MKRVSFVIVNTLSKPRTDTKNGINYFSADSVKKVLWSIHLIIYGNSDFTKTDSFACKRTRLARESRRSSVLDFEILVVRVSLANEFCIIEY